MAELIANYIDGYVHDRYCPQEAIADIREELLHLARLTGDCEVMAIVLDALQLWESQYWI